MVLSPAFVTMAERFFSDNPDAAHCIAECAEDAVERSDGGLVNVIWKAQTVRLDKSRPNFRKVVTDLKLCFARSCSH